MTKPLTKAQEQRLVDLSTYASRLASVLGLNPVEMLEALALCGLTLEKDKHDVVADHQEHITWVPWKGTAT